MFPHGNLWKWYSIAKHFLQSISNLPGCAQRMQSQSLLALRYLRSIHHHETVKSWKMKQTFPPMESSRWAQIVPISNKRNLISFTRKPFFSQKFLMILISAIFFSAAAEDNLYQWRLILFFWEIMKFRSRETQAVLWVLWVLERILLKCSKHEMNMPWASAFQVSFIRYYHRNSIKQTCERLIQGGT